MASHLKTNGRFRSALHNLPEASRAEIARGLDRTALSMQRSAVARAPVDTGRLRKALASKVAIGKRRKGLEVEFGLRTQALRRKAFYASFVEWGRRGYSAGAIRLSGVGREALGRYRKVSVRVAPQPPRPFFVPAVEANIGLWRREMRAALKRALARVSRV